MAVAKASSLCVLALLLVLPVAVHGFHFYLEPGAQRCFVEELPKDTFVVVNYRTLVSEGDKYEENAEVGANINVMEMKSRHTILKLKKDHAGRFAFTSNEAGDHEICFRTNQTAWFRSAQKAKVYWDITVGESGNDVNEKREKLGNIAMQIRDLNNRVIDIRREQQYQKEQEEIFRDTSESVNGRVVWYILLQIAVLLVVAAWQLRHLTVFFTAKKVA